MSQPPRRSPYDDGYRKPPEQPTFTPAAGSPRAERGERPGVGYAEPPAGRAEPPAGRAEPPAGRAEPPAGYAEPPAGQDRPVPQSRPRVQPDDEDVPSWAGLGPEGRAPSRGEQSAARRKKRRYIMIGAAVVVVAGSVGGYLAFGGNSGPANVVSNDLITTFLPGEVQQVPDACASIPSSTMSQYMPGKLKTAAPPLNSGLESQCTWTLDDSPTYRVLEVDLHAYSPSGLASGDGSATFAAIDAYEEAQESKQNPGKKSGEPAAQVTTLKVSGNNAFLATQVYDQGSTIMYVVTEVVRYRNVLVTTVVDGLQESTGARHYGPVSMSDLTTEAQAAAQGATAKVIG